MGWRLVSAWMVIVASAGCLALPGDCPGDPVPPRGDPAAFTAGPVQTDEYSVSAPFECVGAEVPTFRVIVHSTGSRPLYNPEDPDEAPDWHNAVIEWKLTEAGVAWETIGFEFSCGGDDLAAIAVATDNWADASAIADIIAEELVFYDLAGKLQVVVVGATLECAGSS